MADNERRVTIQIVAENLTPKELEKVRREIAGVSSETEKAGKQTRKAADDVGILDKAWLKMTSAFAAGALIERGISAVSGFANSALDSADRIKNLSAQLGISFEATQRFGEAARQSGADIDDVGKAIQTMNVRLAGGNDSTVAALQAAGLKFEDIRRMRPEDAFLEIVDAVEQIRDPMLRARVEYELFGLAGARLAPAIEGGFRRMAEAANVWSNEEVESLARAKQAREDFNREMEVGIGRLIAWTAAQKNTRENEDIAKAAAAAKTYAEDLRAAMDESVKLAARTRNPLIPTLVNATTVQEEFTKATKEQEAQVKKNIGAYDQWTARVRALADELGGGKVATAARELNEALALGGDSIDERLALVKVQSIAAAGGFELLSDEAQQLWLRSNILSDAVGGVDRSLRDLATGGIPIALSKLKELPTLGRIGTGVPTAALGRSIPGLFEPPPSLQAALGGRFFGAGGFSDTLGPNILQALTGGGSVSQAIGASFGSQVGLSFKDSFEQSLKGRLGPKIGGTLAGFLPGVGSLLGPLIGKGISALVGLFKGEGSRVNDQRDQFTEAKGGLEAIHAEIAKFNNDPALLAAFNRLYFTGKEGDFKAGMAAYQARLKELERDVLRQGELFGKLEGAVTAFGGVAPASLRPFADELLRSTKLTEQQRQFLQGLAAEPTWQIQQQKAEQYGITLEALGPQFQQARISDIALGYARDLQLFADVGANTAGVLEGMKDEFSTLVNDAIASGSVLPETLRPWIDKLLAAGQLIGPDGQIRTGIEGLTFAEIEDEPVIASTGVRPAELKRAEPQDVDLDRRVWLVRTAKGGEPRAFWLNDDMLAAMQAFLAADAWGPFDGSDYAKALYAAGWPKNVRPYQARHSVALELGERGIDLGDVQGWLGHRNVQTTRKHYAPVLVSRLKGASERLEGRFKGWQEPLGPAGPAGEPVPGMVH